MGNNMYNDLYFTDLFNDDRTCEFYGDDGNTIIDEDYYGDKVRKAWSNQEVIKWLEALLEADRYWIAEALLATLKALEKSGEEYSLYHFGY